MLWPKHSSRASCTVTFSKWLKCGRVCIFEMTHLCPLEPGSLELKLSRRGGWHTGQDSARCHQWKALWTGTDFFTNICSSKRMAEVVKGCVRFLVALLIRLLWTSTGIMSWLKSKGQSSGGIIRGLVSFNFFLLENGTLLYIFWEHFNT